MTLSVKILQAGATKPANNPYTICIMANPCLETPLQSGSFSRDPILASQGQFNALAAYVIDSLLGKLPGQKEVAFAVPATQFRIVSIFDDSLASGDATCLVGEDSSSNIVVPRQIKFGPLLAKYSIPGVTSLKADVAFAVTGSITHQRCSAWFTADDDFGPGVQFTLDGAVLSHRYKNLHPGTVALHVSAVSLVALHEFGHAASSWTNGSVVDLYVDNNPGLNNKQGRPIPAAFGVMDSVPYPSDPARDGLGYPAGWTSYHAQLNNPAFPAVMDNFWQASTQPEDCEHDRITRQFLLDRIGAIMARP